MVAYSKLDANCLEVGHALQLLRTMVPSLREVLLSEQSVLMSPWELEVVLLVEVVVEGCLENPIEDLELDSGRYLSWCHAWPSWAWQCHC